MTKTEEELVRERAQKVLDDPNSNQLARDLAHLRLAQEAGTVFSEQKPEPLKKDFLDGATEEWTRVEAFESGAISLPGPTVVKIAEIPLIDSNLVVPMRVVLLPNGTASALAAYPKLAGAAQTLIDAKSPQEASGYAVLAILTRYHDRSGAADLLKKAIRLAPKDWRYRSQLASTYMMMTPPKLPLVLQELLVAEELVRPDDSTRKLGLMQRRGKVLFKLQRCDEAKTCLEQVMKDFPSFESEFTKKDVGHNAVAQYMLCFLYALERNKARMMQHWEAAEAKRVSVPVEIRAKIDWSQRAMAQQCIGSVDPSLLSHQECYHCKKLAEDPKKCSACKTAVYCNRACQVAHWKAGHKQNCHKTKESRKTEEKTRKEAVEKAKASQNMPCFDSEIDPKKLWKEACKLALKKTKAAEAVFKFAVALFMDFSLDGQDLTLAKKAVENCGPSDTVAMALRMITHMCRTNPMGQMEQATEKIAKLMAGLFPHSSADTAASYEQVNRLEFGVALCYIFHARIVGRCFAVHTQAQAQSRAHKEAFEDIITFISQAKLYMNQHRWLTMQYELGYSNLDAGAAQEANFWLTTFLNTLKKEQKRCGTSLSRHWTGMKKCAEQRLSMVPLMEEAQRRGISIY